MFFTHHSEAHVLNTFLGNTAVAPAAVYAAAMLSDPGNPGGGTEITYQGYARQSVVFSSPAPISGEVTMENTNDIVFPEALTSAGRITHLGLFDSVVAGNMLAYMILDEPIQVDANVAPLIQAREWSYRLSGNMSQAMATRVLNWLRGQNILGVSPHVALFNGSPDQGGAELSGAGYARVPLEMSTPAIQPAGHTLISNSTLAAFERAQAPWGTWSHTAIYDAASGGNPLLIAQRATPAAVAQGRKIMIRPEELSVSLN